MAHSGKLVVLGAAAPGLQKVFYAHGSESLRTYLGHSKFHSDANCRALLGRNPGKSVIQDWVDSVSVDRCCKVCCAG